MELTDEEKQSIFYREEDFKVVTEEEYDKIYEEVHNHATCTWGDTLEEFNYMIEDFYMDYIVFDFDELVTNGKEYFGYFYR